MRTTPRSETDAVKATRRILLAAGWHDGLVREAVEKPSKRGKDMIEIVVVVKDADGNDRELRDWLTDASLGAVKLRHACEAVGALARYEAGEIGQGDFPGNAVRVRIGVEKKRGFHDRNLIEDYAVSAGAVVSLRAG